MSRNKVLKRIIGGAVALLAFSAFFPGTAFTQGSTWAGENLAQMIEMAHWKFGTLRVNGSLELLNAGYDSDIYYGYLDKPVPDFTLSASVPIQLLIPVSKKIVFDIFDNPQYMFYLDTEKERAWNNMFRGQVHIALEKFYIQAGGGLSNVRRRLSPELDVNIREKTNKLDGLVLWQVSGQTSLAMIYGGAEFDYGDAEFGGTSIAEALNRKENFFDLAAYVQPNPRIRFFLDGQYGTYVFPQESAVSKDARSYGVFGGFEFTPKEGEVVPAARFQGSVNLGYMRFDMKDPQFVDGSGLAGAVDLSVGLLRRTEVRGFFSRGFQFSVYSGASYYIATAYGGGITRRLSRRAFLRYVLTFGQVDYPKDEINGGIPQGSRSRYTNHMASLEIRLAQNLAMTFVGTLGERLFGETAQARNRNFFGLNLVYGYPAGRISASVRGMAR